MALNTLVVLTIDAWRADFVDRFMGVPLLDALAPYRARTARFTRLYSDGPWTTPGLVSMFSGVPVLSHGVHYAWSTPRPGGLARHLARAGFATPDLCYLNQVGNYQNLGYPPDTAPPYPQSPADPVIFEAIAAAGARRGPSMLWYHYKFVHLPYWASPKYRRAFDVQAVPRRLYDSVGRGFIVPRESFRLDPADRPIVQRMYAACVLEMNAWLERVFAALERAGLMDRATVVITADHGEELLEHGHVGHASTAHHGTLFEEVLRIPGLVIDARIPGPVIIDHRAIGHDLCGTMAHLAGAPMDVGGVNFAPAILGGTVECPTDRRLWFHSSRMGYRTPEAMSGQTVVGVSDGRYKYIRERYDREREWLFDLQRDPGELAPILEERALAEWRGLTADVR